MAEPKAQIRDIFLKQVEALRKYAETDKGSLLNQQPGAFFQPDPGAWNGDLFDPEGLSAAFDREEIYEDFRTTLTEEGVTTDLEIEILQGDWIATLERAYRARHHTSARARCHAAARRMGHSDENGFFIKGLQGYLEHLKRLEGGS